MSPPAEKLAEPVCVGLRALCAMCSSAPLTALLASVPLQLCPLLLLLAPAALWPWWRAVNPPDHPVGLERADILRLGSKRSGVPDSTARLSAETPPPARSSERGPRRGTRCGLVHRNEDKKEVFVGCGMAMDLTTVGL